LTHLSLNLTLLLLIQFGHFRFSRRRIPTLHLSRRVDQVETGTDQLHTDQNPKDVPPLLKTLLLLRNEGENFCGQVPSEATKRRSHAENCAGEGRRDVQTVGIEPSWKATHEAQGQREDHNGDGAVVAPEGLDEEEQSGTEEGQTCEDFSYGQ
jgi:hypothetical protein